MLLFQFMYDMGFYFHRMLQNTGHTNKILTANQYHLISQPDKGHTTFSLLSIVGRQMSKIANLALPES